MVEKYAKLAGRPFDSRTPSEAVNEQRSKGIDVLPTLASSNVPFHHHKTGPMFVRGTVSNQFTLGGNEGGLYSFYQSDERGFKNPKGIWDAPTIDVMLFGDSFVHGTSVSMSEDIAGVIREQFPMSLNLGWNGIGPLYYYQSIVEFAVPKNPRFVVFLWFEGNDVTDLLEEENSPLLSQYIGKRDPLGLFEIQNDLDTYHRNRLTPAQGSRRVSTGERILHTVMLYEIRKLLGLRASGSRHAAIRDKIVSFSGGDEAFPKLPTQTLRTLLSDAKTVVSEGGGELIFVYLPAWQRLCQSMPPDTEKCPTLTHDYRRHEVLSIAHSLELEIVDMISKFETNPKLQEMFYFPGSHYSPLGYRLVGEAIVANLKQY